MNGIFVRSLGAVLCIAAVVAAQGISPIGADTCVNDVFGGRPQGGQPNVGNCSLTMPGLNMQGSGPIEIWAPGGATVTTVHTATGPAILLVGTPITGFISLPGLSIDIDIITGALCIYDAIGTGLGAPCVFGAPIFSLTYGIPAGITAKLFSAQGFDLDPSAPFGICATARNDVAAQDLTTLGVPEMPPFTVAVVAPVPAPAGQPNHCANVVGAGNPIIGATTAVYPFPRDAICPNIGAVGTEHSAYCANADATAPGATTATLNGIAVNMLHVRPNEIVFTLTAAHEAAIGGPLVITSTGGTMAVPPPATDSVDQPERWLWTFPTSSANVHIEPALTGFGAGGNNLASGDFGGVAGLVCGIGRKDGNNQVDYWKDETIPAGLTMSTAMIQIDGIMYALGKLQMRVQASGISPTVGPSLNYSATGQPWSQCWPAVTQQCMNDTWMFHNQGDGTGLPGPVNTFPVDAGQDDGACGTNSQRNRPYSPGSETATQPGIDPDTGETTTGMDWHVSNDFGNFYPNPAVVVPYLYLHYRWR